MVTGIAIFFFAYLCFLALLIIGWRGILRRHHAPATDHPLITVVIPVRDEALNLVPLLRDLSGQQYAPFEVIVVNDHSTDETVALATAYAAADTRFSIIDAEGEGKKRALTTGIEAASGSIIVTTDGDCRVSPGWLSSLNSALQDRRTMMAFGGVAILQEGRLFDNMQAIEMASLMGSGASALQWGFPLFCSGANLAFRKMVFNAVDGYADNFGIASGDDEFLMRKVVAKYPGTLVFTTAPGSVVRTKAALSVMDFVQQRMRWAGKWKHNDSGYAKGVAIYIFLVQVTLAGAWVVVLAGDGFLQNMSAVILATRFVAEALFLYPVTRFLGSRWSWLAYAALQLIYPWYVVATALFSIVLKGSWKGRGL